MRLHYDASGRYAGRSQGLGCSCLGFLITAVISLACVAATFFWPLSAFQSPNGRDGPLAWAVQGLWWAFLVSVFLLLGRRAHHVSQRRRAAAKRAAPALPDGPRDWTQDDGARLI